MDPAAFMVELRGVTTRYGPVVANDHLDLVVRRGELLTLLGPSGCGKAPLISKGIKLSVRLQGDAV